MGWGEKWNIGFIFSIIFENINYLVNINNIFIYIVVICSIWFGFVVGFFYWSSYR